MPTSAVTLGHNQPYFLCLNLTLVTLINYLFITLYHLLVHKYPCDLICANTIYLAFTLNTNSDIILLIFDSCLSYS